MSSVCIQIQLSHIIVTYTYVGSKISNIGDRDQINGFYIYIGFQFGYFPFIMQSLLFKLYLYTLVGPNIEHKGRDF